MVEWRGKNLSPNEEKKKVYKNLNSLVYLVEGGPKKKRGAPKFPLTEGPCCGRQRGY